MKKTLIKRAASLLLALLLLIGSPGVTVSAEGEDDGRDRNSNGTVRWSISEDGMTLSDGLNDYRYYEGDYPFVVYADEIYCYSDDLYHPLLSGYYTPYSRKDNDDVVWFYADDYLVYATETGAERLDALFSSPASYRITNDYGYIADLDKSRIESYEAARESGDRNVTYPVSALRNCSMYLLNAMDGNNCLGYVYGAIFDLDGLLFYLNYPSLDNSHFDAEGNLSFRQGELTLVQLSEDEIISLRSVIDSMEVYDYEFGIERQDGYQDSTDYQRLIVTLFWILYALLGFVAPIVFLIPALTMPKKKRYGKPKYWYLLAAFAAAWVILALAILLIMIL